MNFSVDPQGEFVIVTCEVEKLDANNAPEFTSIAFHHHFPFNHLLF